MTRPREVKDGREVTKILQRHGCRIRNCKGSHRVGYLPNGVALTYPDHNEYGPGLRSKISKALIAAGLLVFILALVAFSGPF